MKHARFSVVGVPADVTADELLEAFTQQLMLEGVVMEPTVFLDAEGARSFEFALPEEEAEVLRGPWSTAKVFIRKVLLLCFSEAVPDCLPATPRAAAPIRMGAKAMATTEEEAPVVLPRCQVTATTEDDAPLVLPDLQALTSASLLEQPPPLPPPPPLPTVPAVAAMAYVLPPLVFRKSCDVQFRIAEVVGPSGPVTPSDKTSSSTELTRETFPLLHCDAGQHPQDFGARTFAVVVGWS
eukprot:NODE_14326_length_1115_cov_6.970648.p1 GENE.NODE_14326_length_1115_cov_6.970648~~NODE_14326_length_1115_cov_6.970648.p1  ORF type:complete len:239 (+),score=49.05 NODE_14326_length_1115_cov_6.970648:114-830(+)